MRVVVEGHGCASVPKKVLDHHLVMNRKLLQCLDLHILRALCIVFKATTATYLLAPKITVTLMRQVHGTARVPQAGGDISKTSILA